MSNAEKVVVPAEMDAVNRKFEELFNAGEAARAAREVYTRDSWVVPPGAPLFNGLENVANFWTAAAEQMGVRQVKLETKVLKAYGDWAHEIGEATLSLENGQAVVARYVLVWKKEAGEWRWEVDVWNVGN